jgi:bifunctional non-homologous end joining protein LigD
MGARPLAVYRRKRDFTLTPEPAGKRAKRSPRQARGKSRQALGFVIQKHAARRLHYDFRLEWDGVLRSWAVPKGPSLDPAVKRMAVQVEDHPIPYGEFEGEIPQGQYGAGSVAIWDRGQWIPEGDVAKGLRDGKLRFTLEGQKLHGGFTLVRMHSREGGRQPSWLLIKEKDEHARVAAEFDVLAEGEVSVKDAPRRKARAALPRMLSPQLATLASAPPTAGDWLYELKFDGYRLLARVDGKEVRCFTRSGQDWTSRLPALVKALQQLKPGRAWIDGEIAVLNENDAPDFQQLQNAFSLERTADIRYFVFDLLFHAGEDLRELPQRERRERLRKLIGRSRGPVQFSQSLQGDPRALLAASAAAGFEGIMGKRGDASYQSGRSRDWIKLKSGPRQEFVVGGFTDPRGSRTGFGSLLLGVHDAQGKLRYAGNVGTGFDDRTLATLRKELGGLQADTSPFEDAPRRVGPGRLEAHWIKPKMIAEISFAGWTSDGHVRQGVFQGLRKDKDPRQITREKAQQPKQATAPASKPSPRVTHPDRIIDKSSGATKGELVAYYARVAELILPHLANRPVALIRAPSGIGGQQFFQKHAEAKSLPDVDRLPKRLDPGEPQLLAINSEAGLLSAAQMNMVELHTWNATTAAINKPDRLVFDLDPGAGVDWKIIREDAVLVKGLLDELQIRSFVKTSGGKGLHVVVPLQPSLAWDPLKAFSKRLVQHLARVIPDRFVAKSGPDNRVGKVFVDYLRNGRGATTACAWSARLRPGLPVSVPLQWSELAAMNCAPAWTIHHCDDRLSLGNEPWKDYERSRQSLDAAMRSFKSSGK